MTTLKQKAVLRLPILPVSIAEHDHEVHHSGEADQTKNQVRAKAILVLGPLGSGKTSLVKWILGHNGKVFGKLRLIINDVGAENIDAGRLAQDIDLAAEDVAALKSGCVCCEDLESLIGEVNKVKGSVDTIVIEPTGIAEGDTIAKSLIKAGIETKVVTLMDVLHHQKRTVVEKQVIDTQLAVAQVIGLTWWEGASEEQVDTVLEFIGAKNPHAAVFKLPKLHFGETEIMGDQDQPAYEQLFSALNQGNYMNTDQTGHDHCCHEHGHIHDHGGHTHSHDHQHQKELPIAPVFSRSFIDIHSEFSTADLEKLLSRFSDVLIRAKGVIAGRRFNYVHGSLNWEKYSSEPSVLNFITSEPVDDEQLEYLLKATTGNSISQEINQYEQALEAKLAKYLAMNRGEMLDFSEAEVAKLIAQYHEWMDLDEQIRALQVTFPPSTETNRQIEALQLQQKELGEAMTFANPLVWMLYKIRAYADSPKAIKTLVDLRKHAESPTYICYKRLNYLNSSLKSKFGRDMLDDASISGELNLEELLPIGLVDLCLDEEFMQKWFKFEYFRYPDTSNRLRVGKWENYQK